MILYFIGAACVSDSGCAKEKFAIAVRLRQNRPIRYVMVVRAFLAKSQIQFSFLGRIS